ncbi:MAG TPA: Ig-like domain-containing protein, partial [Ilumatobacter sp.]|nr:Ig-like domain-containing protein [Ilumatobacter sp.]
MSSIKPGLFHLFAGTRRAAWLLAGALVATVPTACKKGEPPTLQDPGDLQAVVGQQLTVSLIASDPEGDDLEFSFEAPAVPDLESTAALARTPDGQAVFTFTPVASQVGSQAFDFIVSDGRNDTRLTVL